MTSCPAVCELEKVSRDEVSPGPVADGEMIARGAYDPSHGKAKKMTFRAALVPPTHLIEGTASVWRIGDNLAVDDLRVRLEIGKEGLFSIPGTSAADIRSIRLGPDGPRAFCVLDECECDAKGNKHPAHAHIALCLEQRKRGITTESPEFVDAHRELIHRLTANRLWDKVSD